MIVFLQKRLYDKSTKEKYYILISENVVFCQHSVTSDVYHLFFIHLLVEAKVQVKREGKVITKKPKEEPKKPVSPPNITPATPCKQKLDLTRPMRIDLSKIKDIQLQTTIADISITDGSSNIIAIQCSDKSDYANLDFTIDRNKDTAKISLKKKPNTKIKGAITLLMNLRLTNSISLKITASKNNISLDGLGDKISLKTTSGDIDVLGEYNECNLKSNSGFINFLGEASIISCDTVDSLYSISASFFRYKKHVKKINGRKVRTWIRR